MRGEEGSSRLGGGIWGLDFKVSFEEKVIFRRLLAGVGGAWEGRTRKLGLGFCYLYVDRRKKVFSVYFKIKMIMGS